MTPFATRRTLAAELAALGLAADDGVFVHASMRAIGPVVSGPRAVIDALFTVVGSDGLVAMPGFSDDAAFPAFLDRHALAAAQLQAIEAAALEFDLATTPTVEIGVIGETFRSYPGTLRSDHPLASICLNGRDAAHWRAPHPIEFASGPESPLGRLCERAGMHVLLIGVGWDRCSALHTAETLAMPRRATVRSIKYRGAFVEARDVAADGGRLFPAVGLAFEETGAVRIGKLGAATARLCRLAELVPFAADWIGRDNARTGDRA